MTDRSARRPPFATALLSVSDARGLVGFAAALSAHGVDLVSTGGTARRLRNAGLSCRDVSELTGYPEMMEGRLKTLHTCIYGGLLAVRDDPSHRASMTEHGFRDIDLLIANPYPFETAVRDGATPDVALAHVDIGGPAMIRAGAKNHRYVTVVVDPDDYDAVTAVLPTGGPDADMRRRLACKAYALTSAYDAAITAWMARDDSDPRDPRCDLGPKIRRLRYGENPHQRGVLYAAGRPRPGVAGARIVQGGDPSYNNVADADAAYELAADLDRSAAACAIIKHGMPCGAASAERPADAYDAALSCDRTSAFGGVVAFNVPLDGDAAERIVKTFTEAVVAPDANADALRVLAARKRLRLFLPGALPDPSSPLTSVRSVAGGMLVQDADVADVDPRAWRVVTARAPTDDDIADLLFARTVVKHAASNAVVFAKNRAATGIGQGQTSRVDAVRIAVNKSRTSGDAETNGRGFVVASDAFFPFADGLRIAADAGATALLQPGGSVRDDEVIAAADAAGVAMVFTGMRHFRH